MGDDIGELEKSQGQKNIGTNQSGQGQGQQVNERGVFGLGNKEDWKEVMRQPGHLPSPPLRDNFPILGGAGTSPGFAAKYLHLPERRRRHSDSFTFCQFSSGWGPLAADPIIVFEPSIFPLSSTHHPLQSSTCLGSGPVRPIRSPMFPVQSDQEPYLDACL